MTDSVKCTLSKPAPARQRGGEWRLRGYFFGGLGLASFLAEAVWA